ncbi:MAG: hypothetical protein ACOYT4_04255 [Nanoarchaeota archaeon]
MSLRGYVNSNLEKIGNVDCNVKQRNVSFLGHIETESLIMKFYDMRADDIKFRYYKDTPRLIENYVKAEVMHQNISPLSGLGFVILSEENLNILRWGDKVETNHPIIPWPKIYCFKGGDFSSVKPGDIKIDGPLCAYESIITAHEAHAWIKYLSSRKTNSDKLTYLEDIFSGRI